MKVFIVLSGEDHKGGSIQGAFTSLKKAITFVENRFPNHARDANEELWVCGCDFVSIERETVR